MGPDEPIFPVAERFISINGEGLQAGRPAAFIRFVGCNLLCSYCDTLWACAPDCEAESLSITELCSWVHESGVRYVTLTGGEPLLQQDLPELTRALLCLEQNSDGTSGQGLWLEFETNGSQDLSMFAKLRKCMGADIVKGVSPVHLPAKTLEDSVVKKSAPATSAVSAAPGATLSFTMDWKLPTSRMSHHMRTENLELLGPIDSVKFVIGGDEDLVAMHNLIEEYELTSRTNVLLSPVFGQCDAADIVSYILKYKLVDVRLQLQLHKFIWPHHEKGV